MTNKRKNELIEEMINILAKENEMNLSFCQDLDRRSVLNVCMLCRDLGYEDEYFLQIQDEFLSAEREEKGIISFQNLKNIEKFIEFEDILRINCDILII